MNKISIFISLILVIEGILTISFYYWGTKKTQKILGIQEEIKSSISKGKNADEEDPHKSYEKENRDLKKQTVTYSPDKRKIGYFQNKFFTDIKELGDEDYTSLIVEYNGVAHIVFQDDFHLSYFKWISNHQINVYDDCGTACLLRYTVDIYTKRYHTKLLCDWC